MTSFIRRTTFGRISSHRPLVQQSGRIPIAIANSSRMLYSSDAKDPLVARIQGDVKDALKAKDKVKAMVLRGVLSDVTYAEKANSSSAPSVSSIIQKAIAKRQEAMTQYKAAGREDLATNEENEAKLLSDYLPKQMSEADLTNMITEIMKELGAITEKDMGKVIKAVLSKVEEGSTTGKVISSIARQLLKAMKT